MATKKQLENVEKLQQMIQFLSNTLANIENDIKRVHSTIKKLENFDPYDDDALEKMQSLHQKTITQTQTEMESEDKSVIHGDFNGQLMIGEDQKKYPVPLNYASKTKLIPGDKLKLSIKTDGKLIYKLVEPAERKHQKAILSLADDQKPIALTDEQQTFFLNQAAVSYYKGTPGDELYIVTNANDQGAYAAIEAVIKQ
jgi:hypothetical protein